MMEATLGFDFIQRTVRTTSVLLLIVLIFASAYLGFYDGLALMSGGVWSIINLIFLSALVRAAIRADKARVDKLTVGGLFLVKFPLLYLAGYFLLQVTVFKPLLLLVGFSIPLAVAVLKVIARALLKMDDRSEANNQLHEAH